jgi:hypothetical protein
MKCRGPLRFLEEKKFYKDKMLMKHDDLFISQIFKYECGFTYVASYASAMGRWIWRSFPFSACDGNTLALVSLDGVSFAVQVVLVDTVVSIAKTVFLSWSTQALQA